jgi:hypothetical protein
MHGIDNVDIAAVRDGRETLADSLESLTEAFTPVCGDQNQAFAGVIETRTR